MFQINHYESPNYSKGRAKYPTQEQAPILAITDHKTAGKYPGCRDWLCNPAAGASAHFVISRTGVIDQLVNIYDTAWHCGIVNRPNWALYNKMGYNPNRWTIGIEHEDYNGDGELGLTEIQYQASLWLHQCLCKEFRIPMNDEYIVGHYRIDSVNRPNCPGPQFPWARLFADLKGGTMEAQKIQDQMRVPAKVFGTVRSDCIGMNVEGRITTYIPAIALREPGTRLKGDTVRWDDVAKMAIIE